MKHALFLLLLLATLPASAYDKALVQEMLASQEAIAGLKRADMTIEGNRLSYLDNQRTTAPDTIMLIHGFGDSSQSWLFFARIFRDAGFRVVIPDLLGFGASARPEKADYGFEAQAKRLLALAHGLGIRRLHLAGNSMGGGIAAAMALLAPDEIATLSLLDAAGIHYRPSELDRELLAGRNILVPKNSADFERLIRFASAERPMAPQPVLDFLAERAVADSALHERIFREALLPDMNFLLPYLTELKTPTLILWGEQDRVLDVENARILARYLPNNELLILPGIGHLPMIEAPEKSAFAVRDFIRRQAKP